MTLVNLRRHYACGVAAAAIAAAAFAAPAMAASTTVTVDEANVLNLLSPFLNLNATTAGQNTLALNLSQAIATNNAAANSPVIKAESIAEKQIYSTSGTAGSETVPTLTTGQAAYYGPGSNLAGGLPQLQLQSGQTFSGSGSLTATTGVAGSINGYQQVGGLGNLGGAFQAAVNPYTTTAAAGTTNYVLPGGATTANSALTGQYTTQNVVNLLVNAYNFNSTDLGVAKYYFANGTTNGTNTAVAPSGYTLPTSSNGQYPNLTTSVYDAAYGVNNQQTNQNSYGDSRPVQVAANSIVQYDPNAITGLTTNPAFPSGHTTYAYTDGILIGMLSPQYFQSMILSASEYGNSRIDLGVHYPLDIIASRSFVQYNLVQLLNATSPVYTTSTVQGTTGQNLNAQFVFAAQSLNGYLNNYINANQASLGCNSLASCAASNTYNTYSAATYDYQAQAEAKAEGVTVTSANENSLIYRYRLTYGLPTYSYTQAPRELTDTQGNTAAILLATLYGGQGNAQAQALANAVTGGASGAGAEANLTTATINQIIYNTEGLALQAFYGAQLSYWSRIDLYDAASYFSNVTGTLSLASTDKVNTAVTVSGTGVLGGSGAINANVTFQQGGALGAQGNGAAGASGYTGLTAQSATFNAGSKVEVTGGAFLPSQTYTLLTTTGGQGSLIIPSNTSVDTSASGDLMTLFTGKLSVTGDPLLQVVFTSNFASAAQTPNQKAVASAIDTVGNSGNYGSNGATLLANLIANNTVATAPAAFNSLSGEGVTGQQDTALNAGGAFVRTVLGQVTYWDGRENDIFGMKDGGSDGSACSLKDGADCALTKRGRFWAAGFGEYASLDGQSSTGSASVTSHNSGLAAGADYELTRNWIGGVAAGYSNSNFSVSDRATTGTVEGGHFAIYGLAHYGDFYLANTTSYAHYDNTTDRTVTGLGTAESERGRFSSNEWISRDEAGYKFRTPWVNVTPFAGVEFAQLSNGAFSETSSGVAGLHVNAQTIDSEKTFAGVQFDSKRVDGNGWALTPYARFSWEHEFSPSRNDTASFLSLPGSTFTIDGAAAAADAARVNAGFKLDFTPNVAVFASFDGEFSGRTDVYGGTGGVKIRW